MPADKKKTAESDGRNRSERLEQLASRMRPGATDSRLMQSNLAESIGFLLRLANGVSMGKVGQRFEALGLRQSLYAVLLIIHENPGLKQQEVGQALSIQQPNLVSLITELVNEGLVQRTTNSGDRRSYSLALTPAGKQRLAQANRAHAENERWLSEAIAPFPLINSVPPCGASLRIATCLHRFESANAKGAARSGASPVTRTASFRSAQALSKQAA